MDPIEAITSVIAKLQNLTIRSTYDNMRTLCSCLEQLQYARQELRKAGEEAAPDGENA